MKGNDMKKKATEKKATTTTNQTGGLDMEATKKPESMEAKSFRNGVAVVDVKQPKATVKSLLSQDSVTADMFSAPQLDKIAGMQSELDKKIQELLNEKKAMMELTADAEFQKRLKFSPVENPTFKDIALKTLHILNKDIGLNETREFFTSELKALIKKNEGMEPW